MEFILILTLGLGLVLFFGACSASKKSDTGESQDLLPEDSLAQPEATSEAKTDALPNAETSKADETKSPDAQPTSTPSSTSELVPTDGAPKSTEVSGALEDYTVQEGDTLMKIAFETYGDLYQWKKIYELNREKVTNPNAIPKGTVLKIEKSGSIVSIERNGDKYLIKKGDTLGVVSEDIYGTKTKWKKLWENNKQLIHDPNRIFAGFYLYYSMSPEEKIDSEKLKQNKPMHMVDNYTSPSPGVSSVGSVSAGTPAIPIDFSNAPQANAGSAEIPSDRNPATK